MQTENPFRYRDVQAPKWIRVDVNFVSERRGGVGGGSTRTHTKKIKINTYIRNTTYSVGVKMTKEGSSFCDDILYAANPGFSRYIVSEIILLTAKFKHSTKREQKLFNTFSFLEYDSKVCDIYCFFFSLVIAGIIDINFSAEIKKKKKNRKEHVSRIMYVLLVRMHQTLIHTHHDTRYTVLFIRVLTRKTLFSIFLHPAP